MRILPRLNMPKRKAARRLWRKCKARLTLRRIYYSVEIVLFIAIYLVVFSGSRLRTLDTFGRRTDAIASLFLVATFILIHVIARCYRRSSVTTLPRLTTSARSSSTSARVHNTLPASINFTSASLSESETRSTPATPRSSSATTRVDTSSCVYLRLTDVQRKRISKANAAN